MKHTVYPNLEKWAGQDPIANLVQRDFWAATYLTLILEPTHND